MDGLVGSSFKSGVRAQVAFTGFKLKGARRRAGWGISCYPDRAAMSLRESGPRKGSRIDDFWNTHPDARAKLFLLHATNHKRAAALPMNLGPFSQAMGGKCYTFALTGVVYHAGWPGTEQPVGDSACEAVFCHLLTLIEKRGIESWSYEDFAWLRTTLRKLDDRGGFSCMLSDGKYLFCYQGLSDANVLSFSQAAGDGSRFRDDDFEFKVPGEAGKSHVGIMVASQSPDERAGWAPFEAEELIVFTGGETVFFNTKRTNPGPDPAFVEEIASLLFRRKGRTIQSIARQLGHSLSQARLGMLALLETGRAEQMKRTQSMLASQARFRLTSVA